MPPRFLLVPVAVLLLAISPPPVSGKGAPGEDEEVIRRALELRAELEELLAGLPPEAREEVERRWREREAPQGPKAAEPPVPVPPAVPVPAPLPEAVPEATDVAAEPDLLEAVEARRARPEPFEPGARGSAAAPPPETDRASESCGTLTLFDSNEDGFLSGADRYWRIFSLWLDDGDGRLEEGEIETLFDAGIRRISARLRSYDSRRGASGDVRIDDAVRLDLLTRNRSATLVIDADKLHRGGEIEIRDASGARASGIQALRGGLVLEAADGRRSRLLCR